MINVRAMRTGPPHRSGRGESTCDARCFQNTCKLKTFAPRPADVQFPFFCFFCFQSVTEGAVGPRQCTAKFMRSTRAPNQRGHNGLTDAQVLWCRHLQGQKVIREEQVMSSRDVTTASCPYRPQQRALPQPQPDTPVESAYFNDMVEGICKR